MTPKMTPKPTPKMTPKMTPKPTPKMTYTSMPTPKIIPTTKIEETHIKSNIRSGHGKRKVSYQHALYTVLSSNNKIPNTIKNSKGAPKKLMRDIYKYSKPFNITFKNKY